MPNPEQPVLDAIDALVDEQLTSPNGGTYPKCPHCSREWHGLPAGSCPGGTSADPWPVDYSPPSALASVPPFATWDEAIEHVRVVANRALEFIGHCLGIDELPTLDTGEIAQALRDAGWTPGGGDA